MERPKLFENGIIPDSLKKDHDEVFELRKSRLLEKREKLKDLEKKYADIPEDYPGSTSMSSDKGHARSDLADLRLEVKMLEEMIHRYEEDPNRDWSIFQVEGEEMHHQIMKDLNFPEKQLELHQEYLEDLKKEAKEREARGEYPKIWQKF